MEQKSCARGPFGVQTWGRAALVSMAILGGGRLLAEPAPIGEEFKVGKAEEALSIPKNCSGAEGDFAVAWRKIAFDIGTRARLFSQDGAPEGPQFDATAEHPGTLAGITCAPDRAFILSWTASNVDGDLTAVFAQRYDSAGATIGSSFQVNDFTVGSQYGGEAGLGPDGSFLMSWTSQGQDGDSNGIFARVYDSSGTRIGGEFQLNEHTLGSQLFGGIGSDASGNVVVTWQSFAQDGDAASIFARRLTTAGALVGTEFQVNSFTPGDQLDPEISVAPDGAFIVTWAGGGSQDGSVEGVFAQRFDSAAAPLGTEIAVNSHTVNSQVNPIVAADDDGDFVIVWDSREAVPFFGDYRRILGQRYVSSGAADGTEFEVSSDDFDGYDDLHYNLSPWVASEGSGDFVVVWRHDFYQGAYTFNRIHGRRYGIKGGPADCGTAPASGCASPGKSSLSVKDKAPAGPGGKDKLIWKWQHGPQTAIDDFGNPVALADYAFCIYAGTAAATLHEVNVPAGIACANGPCWKQSGKGYSYRDTDGATGGITKILLKGGDAGKSKIMVKSIAPPALPLDDANDIVVQLRNGKNANCWESVFQPGDVVSSDEEQYKAQFE